MTLPALQPGDIAEPELKLVDDAEYLDVEVIDGYLVAPDGEILGLAERPAFQVTDQSSAEWVLDKMSRHDAEVAALQMRLKALHDNLEKMMAEEIRRRNFLEYRFGRELTAFAKAHLKGKCKTWRCPFGQVSFRATQPGVEVLDERSAIQWAKAVCPAAVKVKESLLISICKPVILADPPGYEHGFNIVPAGESVTIKTGVAPKKETAREN